MLLTSLPQNLRKARGVYVTCTLAALALGFVLGACETQPIYPTRGSTSGGVTGIAGSGPSATGSAVDGEPCTGDPDCQSGHCSNQICCASGDCCLTEADCPSNDGTTALCEESDECQGTRGAVMCSRFRCRTRDGVEDDSGCDAKTEADDCDLYASVFCTGEMDQEAPECPDYCSDDTACDMEAHCFEGECVSDVPNGGECTLDSECASGHCNGGLCCASGNCCREATDCPEAQYSTPPVCVDAATCQGTRGGPACEDSQCTVADMEDDTGCDRTVVADMCGEGPDVKCRGGVDQGAPPPCATGTCGGGFFMMASCNEEAFCWENECLPDQPNGEGCTGPESCQSNHCENNVCCDEGGDCCENDSQCPPVPICGDLVTCQGERQERYCDTMRGVCANGMIFDDDSSCEGMTSTKDCELNAQPMCTAEEEQADAPPCVRCINLPRCDAWGTRQSCSGEGEDRSCTNVTVCERYVYDIPVGCVAGARCDAISGNCF
jgi:hypothetical protein